MKKDRAWDALEAAGNHPRMKQWLAEADALLGTRPVRRVAIPAWTVKVAAGLAALAFGWGGYQYWAPDRYQTGLGEQRDVTLADGSRITLNTNTSLAVRYSGERRHIDLHRGEALFSVKRDPLRPFDVEAGGTLTRAIGTEFNVDLRGPRVMVSVLEGAVSVVRTDTAAAGAIVAPVPVTALSKGRAVEFRATDGAMEEHTADIRRIDAWRTRRLEFTDTPLTQAVEEFNRYSATRVVIGTPELAAVRVSGVFRIGDAEGFLYSLREALNLETHDSSGEVIVMRSGSGAPSPSQAYPLP